MLLGPPQPGVSSCGTKTFHVSPRFCSVFTDLDPPFRFTGTTPDGHASTCTTTLMASRCCTNQRHLASARHRAHARPAAVPADDASASSPIQRTRCSCCSSACRSSNKPQPPPGVRHPVRRTTGLSLPPSAPAAVPPPLYRPPRAGPYIARCSSTSSYHHKPPTAWRRTLVPRRARASLRIRDWAVQADAGSGRRGLCQLPGGAT